MKLLEKGVYKVFAGLVLISMIGALVAEPVVLGDISAYYLYKHLKEKKYDAAVEDASTLRDYTVGDDYGIAKGIEILSDVAEDAVIEDGLLAAGVATGGAVLIGIGVGMAL